MTDILRISLVQWDVAWENPAANRLKLDQLLVPIQGSTDLIVLPEMFTTGFSMKANMLSETMEGESVRWMKSQAKKTGAALAGSLIVRENDHHYNRFLFITPAGDVFSYDKKHLFSMGGEDQYFNPGNTKVVVDYLGWRIALFTCYDLRFPVWCRSVNDVDLMLFTANWPDARQLVWQTLTRARAIENQLYVAGVNRTGTDGSGVVYSGESLMINPKGVVIYNLGNRTEAVETCDISMTDLSRFRKKFPVSLDADSFEFLR